MTDFYGYNMEYVQSASVTNDIKPSQLTTAIKPEKCGVCFACSATVVLDASLTHLSVLKERQNTLKTPAKR